MKIFEPLLPNYQVKIVTAIFLSNSGQNGVEFCWINRRLPHPLCPAATGLPEDTIHVLQTHARLLPQLVVVAEEFVSTPIDNCRTSFAWHREL